MNERVEELARTTALALMQFVPLVGGPAAQLVSHAWSSPILRRQVAWCESVARELEYQKREVEWLSRRLNESEASASLAIDVTLASLRASTDEHRLYLARLFVSSLPKPDPEIANVQFLLSLWESLDQIQRTALLAMASDRTAHLGSDFPELFGESYFGGADHDTRMFKDDLHRRRVEQMLSAGVIRPVFEDSWKAGQSSYSFINFRPTATGRRLVAMLKD